MTRGEPKWEQALRTELAGDLVWQHPYAEAVLQWFQVNQRALGKKPQGRQPMAAAVREHLIESERALRSMRRAESTRKALATRRLRRDLKAAWLERGGSDV